MSASLLPQPGLGTLLRHLTELLDGEVEAVYLEAEIDCRSRFTPIIRHIEANGPGSLRQIADATGLTHSAISQTVGEMRKRDLVALTPGRDGRERIVAFTPKAEALLPRLHAIWQSIWAAADDLSAEIGTPLHQVLGDAIAAAERRSFGDRIRARHRTGAIK